MTIIEGIEILATVLALGTVGFAIGRWYEHRRQESERAEEAQQIEREARESALQYVRDVLAGIQLKGIRVAPESPSNAAGCWRSPIRSSVPEIYT